MTFDVRRSHVEQFKLSFWRESARNYLVMHISRSVALQLPSDVEALNHAFETKPVPTVKIRPL